MAYKFIERSLLSWQCDEIKNIIDTVFGREPVMGWNSDLLQKSTLLDNDYFRINNIEACSQYRYQQASSKNSNLFKNHDPVFKIVD
jgi:hypothetical protein